MLRGKDPAENGRLFDDVLQYAVKAGRKLGLLPKDKICGPFYDEWKSALDRKADQFDQVDIAPLISQVLAIKDTEELRSMRDGSKACVALMEHYFIPEMSELLDSDAKITHAKLAQQIQGKLEDPRFFAQRQLGLPESFDSNLLDMAGNIVIQSGGNFDLRKEAQSDDSQLYPGVIVARIPVRYNTYASIVTRTFLVDPSKEQEKAYKLLCQVHNAMLETIKDGVMAKEVYGKASNLLNASAERELKDCFVKAVGTGIGLELRDSNLILNQKSPYTLRDGQTITVISGFAGIETQSSDPRKQTYAMMLMDTVRVANDRATVFTKGAAIKSEDVSFYFKDDEPAAKPKDKEKTAKSINTNNVVKSKLRSERAAAVDDGAEQRRRDHQRELHAKKKKEGEARFAETRGPMSGEVTKTFKRFESYKRDNQLPSKVKELMIVVDERASTVVLPIMGRPVPFHINTIKNSSANDEGEYMQLRINLLSPGQGVGRKDDRPFEDANAHFVRSLTFRSKDVDRMIAINEHIQQMKKDAQKREQDKKQMEDVVEQDSLIVQPSKRPLTMTDLSIRPALEGKRVLGNLEIHSNGVRYTTSHSHHGVSQRVDVLFNNVKHLFFQPCVQEMIVIIHFHLHNPIMIGKKKTKDVQLYREAIDMAADETGNRKRKNKRDDADELRAEQEERRRRAELDRHFQKFANQIAEAGRDEGLDVDIPFRELGFQGVPFRSAVFLQPTTDALVQLTEFPVTCLSLEDIEVCHLERVQYGLKNFDMVFVFKDYNRSPMHVNTVPVESLESVKEWLDSVNVPFSEGRLNLNWGVIMKTVVADPHEFFAAGGWGFIADESDAGSDDEEEEESNFEADSDSFGSEGDSSEAESAFDDDASADEGEGGSSDGGEDDGDDWDELERKAKKRDREGEFDSADEGRGAKKKSRR